MSVIQVKASSFEIFPAGKSLERSKQQLSGWIKVDGDDIAGFEALKQFSSRKDVDKIIIVYRDYAFQLLGVSFTEKNTDPPSFRLDRSYEFRANEIQLKV